MYATYAATIALCLYISMQHDQALLCIQLCDSNLRLCNYARRQAGRQVIVNFRVFVMKSVHKLHSEESFIPLCCTTFVPSFFAEIFFTCLGLDR